jgi:hypothetical protein
MIPKQSKKKGKGGTAPKTPPRASRPKKLKFVVGRWYLDGEGFPHKVTSVGEGDGYPIRARKKGHGYVYSFSYEGKFFAGRAEPHRWDLVREVPSAKRGGAKRSRPKSSPKSKRGAP